MNESPSPTPILTSLTEPGHLADPAEPTRRRWVVAKFGGTSVATAARWKRILAIARARAARGGRVLLVASAVATVSNRLIALVDATERGDDVRQGLADLRALHLALGDDLDVDAAAILADELAALDAHFAAAPAVRPLPAPWIATALAFGERLSTCLGAAWLTANGLPCAWLDARELLTASPHVLGEGDPRDAYLAATCDPTSDRALQDRLAALPGSVAITQGFIARNPDGDTVLLGRGGSDTSAAYLAVALDARRLEIWTDVAGLYTADPRIVAAARPMTRVDYESAEVLASMGAKVLHPRALAPARRAGVPIDVRCIDQPQLRGTRIDRAHPLSADAGPFAVASRKDLTLLTMRREAGWQPVGFMADVAERFRAHGLSMDVVATSPGDIRATIDRVAHPALDEALPALLDALRPVCDPDARGPVASVSVVGRRVQQLLPVLGAALQVIDPPACLHMAVHAADDTHLTWVVDAEVAPILVCALHDVIAAAGAPTTPPAREAEPAAEPAAAPPVAVVA